MALTRSSVISSSKETLSRSTERLGASTDTLRGALPTRCTGVVSSSVSDHRIFVDPASTFVLELRRSLALKLSEAGSGSSVSSLLSHVMRSASPSVASLRSVASSSAFRASGIRLIRGFDAIINGEFQKLRAEVAELTASAAASDRLRHALVDDKRELQALLDRANAELVTLAKEKDEQNAAAAAKAKADELWTRFSSHFSAKQAQLRACMNMRDV